MVWIDEELTNLESKCRSLSKRHNWRAEILERERRSERKKDRVEQQQETKA